MKVPDDFIGKYLIELDLRRKYNVTVVVVSHGIGENKRVIVSPPPDELFKEGDIFVVFGENKDLEKLRKKMNA